MVTGCVASRIQQRVTAVLTSDIQKEMSKLCARNTRSLLKQSSVTASVNFHGKHLLKK